MTSGNSAPSNWRLLGKNATKNQSAHSGAPKIKLTHSRGRRWWSATKIIKMSETLNVEGTPAVAVQRGVRRAVALSIRQPWAHLIIYGAKDVENRDWPTRFRGRVLIHAGKTMTRADYEACVIFCSGLPEGTLPEDFWFPTFDELKSKCGGIVGVMNIVDCVTQSESPWFCGRYGFKVDAAAEMTFYPCKGMLGFFQSEHA